MLEDHRLAEAPTGTRGDDEIGTALLAQLDALKNPESVAACAVALGLARHAKAAPRIRELLERNVHQDELAGYLCIGLGLLGDTASLPAIRGVVERATRRPQLLLQAAIALGMLGDKRAADLLVDGMEQSQNLAALSSLAFAIGKIGDRRSIPALVGMLEDESALPLARAFAAVALGGVADKEREPWNAKIARTVNYRAAVETLTNQVSGILDIL